MELEGLLPYAHTTPKPDDPLASFKESLANWAFLSTDRLEYRVPGPRFARASQTGPVEKDPPTRFPSPSRNYDICALYPRTLPTAPARTRTSPGAVIIGRINHLFGFVDFMYKSKVLQEDETIDSSITQRKIQKCAYIAQQLGIPFDYRFGFLTSGAFSVDMAVDLYRRRLVNEDINPFDGRDAARQTFLDMVMGKSNHWLHVATFAMRRMDTILSSDDFVEYMERKNSQYGKRLVRAVFEHMRRLAGSTGQ